MQITVITGGTTTKLSSDITVKSGGRITALNNRATIDPVYDQIAAALPAVVKTINGVSPNEKGEFFLSGSECTSWEMLPDMHGFTLVDLCPACKDCESLYRLKQEVERLKMWLTLLKDVNLYTDAGSSNQINLLWLRRLEKIAACGEYVLGDDYDTFYQQEHFTKSLQLIQQYMTLVHMWNYMVNRNNMSDVIQVAPEDTSGFAVQTKRSITSCNKKQSIRCVIEITNGTVMFDDGTSADLADVGASENYPVSVFIPRAVLTFEPFDHNDADQTPEGIPVITTSNHVTKNMDINPAPTGAPVYKRSIDTGDIESVAAGTYVVNAKFLPFVYSVMEDAEGNPISIRGTTAYTVPGTTAADGSVTFQFFASDSTPEPLAEPTAEDYLNAKTAPTCSVNFKIMWHILITWSVTENGVSKSIPQTYNYVCNGIRRYYSSSVINGSTIAAAVPEEPADA